jgi:hypothetical protein
VRFHCFLDPLGPRLRVPFAPVWTLETPILHALEFGGSHASRAVALQNHDVLFFFVARRRTGFLYMDFPHSHHQEKGCSFRLAER